MATLHLTRTFPALLPRYVTRFSCIGAACEDTCCSGWTVTLDKKTFNAYRQSKHPALSQLFAQKLRRQRSQESDRNYGRIEMEGKECACPMMNEGLCKVQANLGESYLSNTCFNFPRITHRAGGQVQQALQLSCPEAARQALLAPDAFEFVEGTVTVRPEELGSAPARHGISVELMSDLRIFCMQLMRAEGLELWQRLALLGVFCEMLSQAIAGHRQSEISSLVDSFVTMVESGEVLDALRDLQPNHAAQALVFARLWARKPAVARSENQRIAIETTINNLGADPETGIASEASLEAAYRAGVQRLPLALEAAPHLLEHYVLNEMFMHMFPFEGSDPYESYLQLISRYGLLRLMLAAQCNTAGALPTPLELSRTVQVYCRRFRHDIKFADDANAALRAGGWDSLDKLYGFLRH